MYERFTDGARKAMELAHAAARRWNHGYVGSEHILLGLLEQGSAFRDHDLVLLGTDCEAIRAEVEMLLQVGTEVIPDGKLPQTPRAKKTIEYAIDESRRVDDQFIGVEHLLLGCLREAEGIAAQVLTKIGMKLDVMQEALRFERSSGRVLEFEPGKFLLQAPLPAPDAVMTPQQMLLKRLAELADGLDISTIIVMGTRKTSKSS